MKIKAIISKTFIALGTILVCYSAVLFVLNQKVEENAKNYSQNVVQQFSDIVQVSSTYVPSEDFNETTQQENQLPKISIDNELYTGILTIPTLNLELPIQSDWSYSKLKNTPCVYEEQPFSIAGHNYTSHFGSLSNLIIGDEVIFTDVNGMQTVYSVELVETIYETEIEALQDESYALTIFTCSYTNNNYRILVRLNIKDSTVY